MTTMLAIIFLVNFVLVVTEGQFQNVDINSCKVGLKLSCGEDSEKEFVTPSSHLHGQGKPGKRGPTGPRGPIGPRAMKGQKGEPCNCEDRLSEIQNQLDALKAIDYKEAAGCPQTKFKFPREGQTSDWIQIKTPIPTTDALTVCAWITPLTSSGVNGAFASYATSTVANNEFLVHFLSDRRRANICFNQCLDISITITSRTHFCVSGSPSNAWAKVYRNGVFHTRLDYSSRRSVTGGGAFLLGQEQDDVAGSFDANQAFGGTVENFMMWYRALDASEIQALHNDRCDCPQNHAISLAPSEIQIEGKVISMAANQC